ATTSTCFPCSASSSCARRSSSCRARWTRRGTSPGRSSGRWSPPAWRWAATRSPIPSSTASMPPGCGTSSASRRRYWRTASGSRCARHRCPAAGSLRGSSPCCASWATGCSARAGSGGGTRATARSPSRASGCAAGCPSRSSWRSSPASRGRSGGSRRSRPPRARPRRASATGAGSACGRRCSRCATAAEVGREGPHAHLRARRRHVRRDRPAARGGSHAGARAPDRARRAGAAALDVPARVGARVGHVPHREAAGPPRRLQLPEPRRAPVLGLQRDAGELVLLPRNDPPRPRGRARWSAHARLPHPDDLPDVPGGVVVSGPPVPDRRRAYACPAGVEAELGMVSPLTHDELNAAKRNRDVAAVDRCNRFELDLLERTTRRYLEAGTDLLVVFTGIPDGLHHNFWAFHDPTSPLHEPDAPLALRTLITRWYEEIDAAIGRLVADLGDDTAVLVVSDHGGGPAPSRHLNVNAFLRGKGYLEVAGAGRAQVASGVRRVIDRARQQVPGRMWLKRNLPERVQRRLRGLRNATAAIAWERTRAYAIPVYYPITGVWVNLRGRQPRGVVAPGAEYEALRDALVRDLGALVDPISGAPLVRSVRRREEVYEGPHVADAPDLVVETMPGLHGGFDLDRLVTEVPPSTLRAVNGSHTPEGI